MRNGYQDQWRDNGFNNQQNQDPEEQQYKFTDGRDPPEMKPAEPTNIIRKITDLYESNNSSMEGFVMPGLVGIKIGEKDEQELKNCKTPMLYYIKLHEVLLNAGLKNLIGHTYNDRGIDQSSYAWTTTVDTIKEIARIVNDTAPQTTIVDCPTAPVINGRLKAYLDQFRSKKLGSFLPEYYKLYSLGDEAHKYRKEGDMDNLRITINKMRKMVSGRYLDQSIQQWLLFQFTRYIITEKKGSAGFDAETVESWSYTRVVKETDKLCKLYRDVIERAEAQKKMEHVFIAREDTSKKSKNICRECADQDGHEWTCKFYGLPAYDRTVRMHPNYFQNLENVIERRNSNRDRRAEKKDAKKKK